MHNPQHQHQCTPAHRWGRSIVQGCRACRKSCLSQAIGRDQQQSFTVPARYIRDIRMTSSMELELLLNSNHSRLEAVVAESTCLHTSKDHSAILQTIEQSRHAQSPPPAPMHPTTPLEPEYSPGLQSVHEEVPVAGHRPRSAAVCHSPRSIYPGYTHDQQHTKHVLWQHRARAVLPVPRSYGG